MSDILCEVTRGRPVESVHRGAVAVIDGARAVYVRGRIHDPAFMRSAAKPFQAAAVVECGAADAFGFSAEELAVIAGSHGGEREDVRAVSSILKKARLLPGMLQCGTHAPFSSRAQEELRRAGKEPTVLHNNCSGKHAGMLAAARRLEAPLESYLQAGHPVQRANLALLARFAGVREGRVAVAADGCSAPTFALPVASMARAVARLCADDGPAERVRAAMMRTPSHVGRPCAQVMGAAPGRLVAKAGAEGVYVCGLAGRGIGIAIKVEDGSARPVVHVLRAVLEKLGLLGKAELARLRKVADPVLRNHAGKEVGEIRPLV